MMSLAKVILFSSALAVLAASILIWRGMPIYPDEIAFRIHVGRYLQDHETRFLLWSLCAPNGTTVPWLFALPARLMSMFDLWLSPAQGRFVSILSVLGCVASACCYLIKRINFSAVLLFTASVIGVAGSSMVLARYEWVLLLNITCCILALCFVSTNTSRSGLRWLVAALLAFVTVLSLYVHPQGLVFLPLSMFMFYRVIFGEKLNTPGISISLIAFGYCAYTAHTFLNLSCPPFPQVEAYWGGKTFNPLDFYNSNMGITEFFTKKIGLYVSRFIYNEHYQADLPTLTSAAISSSHLLKLLNAIIPIILLVIIFLNVVASFFVSTFYMGYYFLRRKEWLGIKFNTAVFYLLLFVPAFALFLCDVELNFYRCIALHFLFVLALAILFADIRIKAARHTALLLGGIFLITGILSIDANKIYFTGRLAALDGSSLSLSRNWGGLSSEVKELANMCGIDLTSGRGIMSNYTYDGLKQYNTLYHINYLALQVEITKLSVDDVLRILKPNYAIAACADMEGKGFTLPIQARRGELCCYNFLKNSNP